MLISGDERCVFQAGSLRNAANPVSAVRATDVMVNVTRFDDDLWFQHLEFIFVFLGIPQKKLLFRMTSSFLPTW